jgi:FAD-dependent urate hydroxylase
MQAGLALLEQQIAKDLEILAHPGKSWVPSRHHPSGSHVYDVVVVGAGQSGLGIGFGLKREYVTNILIIDRASAGREGPWVTYARMQTLRTVKNLIGIDFDLPNLTFQAWYEAQHGEAGFVELERIPRVVWMDYLNWFRRVLDLPVQNETELVDLGPTEDGALIRLDVLRHGRPETLFCRKVVLATGMTGSGGMQIPGGLTESLPRHLWAHTAEEIDFDALRGKRVGVLGAGASAFDNAITALEAGAEAVDLCVRRAELPRLNFVRALEFSGLLRFFADLPDEQRWRFMLRVFELPVPPPQSTYDRALAMPGFTLRMDCPWLGANVSGAGDVQITTPAGLTEFDFVIFGTGFFMDITHRPELRSIIDRIALWRDRYSPPAGLESLIIGAQPYLGRDLEFTEKDPGTAPWLKNMLFFGIAGTPSLAPISAGLNGMKFGLWRVVGGICRSLFTEDFEHHYQNYVDYRTPEFDPRRERLAG